MRGTYALGLRLDARTQCTIGALGVHDLPAGFYIYVGSAWGAGGIAARLTRHLRGGKRLHWHIDYLRRVAQPVWAWNEAGVRNECAWARVLGDLPLVQIPVPRFGASDCACATHLFYLHEYLPEAIPLPNGTPVVSGSNQDILPEEMA